MNRNFLIGILIAIWMVLSLSYINDDFPTLNGTYVPTFFVIQLVFIPVITALFVLLRRSFFLGTVLLLFCTAFIFRFLNFQWATLPLILLSLIILITIIQSTFLSKNIKIIIAGITFLITIISPVIIKFFELDFIVSVDYLSGLAWTISLFWVLSEHFKDKPEIQLSGITFLTLSLVHYVMRISVEIELFNPSDLVYFSTPTLATISLGYIAFNFRGLLNDKNLESLFIISFFYELMTLFAGIGGALE